MDRFMSRVLNKFRTGSKQSIRVAMRREKEPCFIAEIFL